MKNKILRYIFASLISMLVVWFIISFLYFFDTGNVIQFLISGSIGVFLIMFWHFNEILK